MNANKCIIPIALRKEYMHKRAQMTFLQMESASFLAFPCLLIM